MKKPSVPSPVKHPNAYAGFSVASAAALLVYEAETRLGITLTDLEASFIVGGAVTLALFLGKKASRG